MTTKTLSFLVAGVLSVLAASSFAQTPAPPADRGAPHAAAAPMHRHHHHRHMHHRHHHKHHGHHAPKLKPAL